MSTENSRTSEKNRKKRTPNDIFDILLMFLIIIPIIYGISFIILSRPVNMHWNSTIECTIKDVGILTSGARSYSKSQKVLVFTEECGDEPFEYAGIQNMTNKEFADKVNELVGKKVKIKVGNWQLPMSLQNIYYVEGATPQ